MLAIVRVLKRSPISSRELLHSESFGKWFRFSFFGMTTDWVIISDPTFRSTFVGACWVVGSEKEEVDFFIISHFYHFHVSRIPAKRYFCIQHERHDDWNFTFFLLWSRIEKEKIKEGYFGKWRKECWGKKERHSNVEKQKSFGWRSQLKIKFDFMFEKFRVGQEHTKNMF